MEKELNCLRWEEPIKLIKRSDLKNEEKFSGARPGGREIGKFIFS